MWYTSFFLVLTIIFWGLAPILEKPALKGVDPITGVFIRTAAVFFILLVWEISRGRAAYLFKLPPRSVLLFVLSGISAGLLGMFCYFKVLKLHPASRIVPLSAVYPLVTALLSVLILKEGFSWQRFLGTILITAGVFLVK